MKTKMLRKEEVKHQWYVIDVKDKILGRVATEISILLIGKDKPDYTPNVDSGAGVIVLNCDKIKVSGKKNLQKVYKTYSGYPSGQKEIVFKDLLKKDSKIILRHAIKGMLPKNKLGTLMLKRLKLYIGENHRQEAQKPIKKEI